MASFDEILKAIQTPEGIDKLAEQLASEGVEAPDPAQFSQFQQELQAPPIPQPQLPQQQQQVPQQVAVPPINVAQLRSPTPTEDFTGLGVQ